MPTTFVTAAQEEKQVTSHQARLAHAHTFGAGRYLLDGLKLTMETSNRLKAGAGVMLVDGSYITVDEAGQEWTIENGTQAMKRIDLAGYEYAVDEHGVESLTPKVLKGTPHASAPTAPTYPKATLVDRPASTFIPVAKVELDSIMAKPPTCVLEPLPTVAECSAAIEDTGWKPVWVNDEQTIQIYHRRIGGVVYLRGDVAGGFTIGGDWKSVTTVSEGFRPDATTSFAGSLADASTPVHLTVRPNGLLSANCIRGASYWSFSTSYPAAK